MIGTRDRVRIQGSVRWSRRPEAPARNAISSAGDRQQSHLVALLFIPIVEGPCLQRLTSEGSGQIQQAVRCPAPCVPVLAIQPDGVSYGAAVEVNLPGKHARLDAVSASKGRALVGAAGTGVY